MRMKLAAIVVPLTGTVSAHAQTGAIPRNELHHASIGHHVYVNAATGERTVTTAPMSERGSPLVFANEDSGLNGNFFWGMDNPTRTFPTSGTVRVGGEAVSRGDVAFNTWVDRVRVGYVTNILHDGTGVVGGLSLVLSIYDCYNEAADPEASLVAMIVIEDIGGWDEYCNEPDISCSGWAYTIDLGNSGLEFEIGDTDGVNAGGTGCDKDDLDGHPLADFAWSYSFIQGQAGPLGIIGPFLALPAHGGLGEDTDVPTGATGNAEGVPDIFDLFSRPTGHQLEFFEGSLNFGGWPLAPWASSTLGLYGSSGRDCSPADYAPDGTVDVLDFLNFIDDFAACENQPAPCGSLGDPDINGDGLVDILDFLDFIDVFGICG
jgi:hypothetical protein